MAAEKGIILQTNRNYKHSSISPLEWSWSLNLKFKNKCKKMRRRNNQKRSTSKRLTFDLNEKLSTADWNLSNVLDCLHFSIYIVYLKMRGLVGNVSILFRINGRGLFVYQKIVSLGYICRRWSQYTRVCDTPRLAQRWFKSLIKSINNEKKLLILGEKNTGFHSLRGNWNC